MSKIPGPKNSNSKMIVNRPETKLPAKPEKRDNLFSQSRDTREDRDLRQLKTTHNSQTFPHAH